MALFVSSSQCWLGRGMIEFPRVAKQEQPRVIDDGLQTGPKILIGPRGEAAR